MRLTKRRPTAELSALYLARTTRRADNSAYGEAMAGLGASAVAASRYPPRQRVH